MGMFEKIIEDQIYIDFASEILFGEDQAYESYPCRFATVNFELMPTDMLDTIVNKMRWEAGYPMLPTDTEGPDLYDPEMYYSFYTGIHDYKEPGAFGRIEVVVHSDISPDDGESYFIELTDDECIALYNRLDEQVRTYLGKSCTDLLADAGKEMLD